VTVRAACIPMLGGPAVTLTESHRGRCLQNTSFARRNLKPLLCRGLTANASEMARPAGWGVRATLDSCDAISDGGGWWPLRGLHRLIARVKRAGGEIGDRHALDDVPEVSYFVGCEISIPRWPISGATTSQPKRRGARGKFHLCWGEQCFAKGSQGAACSANCWKGRNWQKSMDHDPRAALAGVVCEDSATAKVKLKRLTTSIGELLLDGVLPTVLSLEDATRHTRSPSLTRPSFCAPAGPMQPTPRITRALASLPCKSQLGGPVAGVFLFEATQARRIVLFNGACG